MSKTIGILGGMSPESTIEYYRYIVHSYIERFDDLAYPEIIIYSVSFQHYVDWPEQGRWDLVGKGLGKAAQKLESAGADFIIIATNTMHIVVDDIREAIDVPVLSLLEVVGEEIRNDGKDKVGLLGTTFAMEHGFYQRVLGQKGVEVIVPNEEDREIVNHIIYQELVNGIIQNKSREQYVKIIDYLENRGAEGIILGCTEIPLLIRESDTELDLYDTIALHACAALDFALSHE